jgi:hypothetical protein
MGDHLSDYPLVLGLFVIFKFLRRTESSVSLKINKNQTIYTLRPMLTVRNNFRCCIGKAHSGKIPIPHRKYRYLG